MAGIFEPAASLSLGVVAGLSCGAGRAARRAIQLVEFLLLIADLLLMESSFSFPEVFFAYSGLE